MKLKGKKINFLGDSITEGSCVEDIKANRYDNVLKKTAKLKAVYNFGIGGSRLAHQTKPSEKPRHDLCFAGRAYDLNTDADITVVYGGVNDYLHGDAPIGEWGDKTPATFYGAVRFLMALLKERYPKQTLVFLTPARCYFDGMDMRYPSTDKRKGSDAMPLIEYVNIIKRTAEDFDIPVLDLYNALPIDPYNEGEYKKYTADGLHFNDAGHHVLAAHLKSFLEAL